MTEEAESSATRGEDSLAADFAVARATFDHAIAAVKAAVALLRAELRLARSSAVLLIGLAFLLVFFGVGAWLATSAAIAAGIYRLTGSLFYGIGAVALGNLAGAAWALWAMRGCWHDLGLPRTRRAIGEIGKPRP